MDKSIFLRLYAEFLFIFFLHVHLEIEEICTFLSGANRDAIFPHNV